MLSGLHYRAVRTCGPILLLLAGEVADPVCIEEYDAGELTGPMIRDMERRLAIRGFGKGGRAVVVNEAHGLKPEAIRALLVAAASALNDVHAPQDDVVSEQRPQQRKQSGTGRDIVEQAIDRGPAFRPIQWGGLNPNLKISDDQVALCLRQKPDRSQVAVAAEGF